MPFIPFKKGTNSHPPGTFTPKSSLKEMEQGKPTPAGPDGKWDPSDSPGQDENGDGIYGKPVKGIKSAAGASFDKAALTGLKSSFRPSKD